MNNEKQREIKFRVWDVGQMFYTVTVGQNPAVLESGGEWAECTEDCVVMQYIGLEDENGKEIYEGDVVNHNGWAGFNPTTVVFENCGFSPFALMEHEGSATKATIIGNIYENCELLERIEDE